MFTPLFSALSFLIKSSSVYFNTNVRAYERICKDRSAGRRTGTKPCKPRGPGKNHFQAERACAADGECFGRNILSFFSLYSLDPLRRYKQGVAHCNAYCSGPKIQTHDPHKRRAQGEAQELCGSDCGCIYFAGLSGFIGYETRAEREQRAVEEFYIFL